MVQFRSFQTKHALMFRIREQDKVPVLKHVLCSLMNMPDFFHVKIFNTVNIKKILGNSYIDEKFRPTSVGTIPITWWYIPDEWHLQQRIASCLSHQRIFRGTRHYVSGNTPSHVFHTRGSLIFSEVRTTLLILYWRFL